MNKKVCVSLKNLYETGNPLKDRSLVIKKEETGKLEWFDLYNSSGRIICMDGEACEVVSVGNDFAVLLNREGTRIEKFALSKEEFKIATAINLSSLLKEENTNV